ncbi:MAG: hypothetical protein ACRC2T_11110, partial [Thermoguttaceae bacterium]
MKNLSKNQRLSAFCASVFGATLVVLCQFSGTYAQEWESQNTPRATAAPAPNVTRNKVIQASNVSERIIQTRTPVTSIPYDSSDESFVLTTENSGTGNASRRNRPNPIRLAQASQDDNLSSDNLLDLPDSGGSGDLFPDTGKEFDADYDSGYSENLPGMTDSENNTGGINGFNLDPSSSTGTEDESDTTVSGSGFDIFNDEEMSNVGESRLDTDIDTEEDEPPINVFPSPPRETPRENQRGNYGSTSPGIPNGPDQQNRTKYLAPTEIPFEDINGGFKLDPGILETENTDPSPPPPQDDTPIFGPPSGTKRKPGGTPEVRPGGTRPEVKDPKIDTTVKPPFPKPVLPNGATPPGESVKPKPDITVTTPDGGITSGEIIGGGTGIGEPWQGIDPDILTQPIPGVTDTRPFGKTYQKKSFEKCQVGPQFAFNDEYGFDSPILPCYSLCVENPTAPLISLGVSATGTDLLGYLRYDCPPVRPYGWLFDNMTIFGGGTGFGSRSGSVEEKSFG